MKGFSCSDVRKPKLTSPCMCSKTYPQCTVWSGIKRSDKGISHLREFVVVRLKFECMLRGFEPRLSAFVQGGMTGLTGLHSPKHVRKRTHNNSFRLPALLLHFGFNP